ESLETTLNYYASLKGEEKLRSFTELYRKSDFRQMIFTGMGSSYFISYAASCLFNDLGIHACAMNASELLYYNYSLITEKTLLVCISQSGESIEVVKLLKNLPPNVTAIGIGNEENSSLKTLASDLFLSIAGKEEMTSTKTYTAITMVAYILGWSLAGKWGPEKILKLRSMIAAIKENLEGYNGLSNELISFLGDVNFLQFIGRGPIYGTVLQSELMFKEAAGTASTGTLGGEFRHGPMEMVGPEFKSVLFAAEGKTYKQSLKMAYDIAKYNGKVILIANKMPDKKDKNIEVIFINQPDEYLFNIQSIIPIQFMVNTLAVTKGREPGNFVHGSKVTIAE
ncbi:MAG TPA: SIS domain-containing protein, partial [Ignavibacteriales bacterium]|nr:SIS domain-containing protein [Ignavibacteriales bacterium]